MPLPYPHKDSADVGDEATKEELLERARELDIEGRSNMTKHELVDAINAAQGAQPEPEGPPGWNVEG